MTKHLLTALKLAYRYTRTALTFVLAALGPILWGLITGLVEGLIFFVAGFTKTGRRVTRNTMVGRGAVRTLKGKRPF